MTTAALAAAAVLWSSIPLWRATPDAQLHSPTELLVAHDCHQQGREDLRVRAVVARTTAEQEKGLSHRKQPLSPQEGMLFWFDPPRPQAIFWMKDTHIPLTLLYFDHDGRLVSQHTLQVEPHPEAPKKLYTSPPTPGGIEFALEISPRTSLPAAMRLCFPAR